MAVDELAQRGTEIKYALFNLGGTMCAIFELEYTPGKPHYHVKEMGAISNRADLVAMVLNGNFKRMWEGRVQQSGPVIADYEDVPDLAQAAPFYYSVYQHVPLRLHTPGYLDLIREVLEEGETPPWFKFDPNLTE